MAEQFRQEQRDARSLVILFLLSFLAIWLFNATTIDPTKITMVAGAEDNSVKFTEPSICTELVLTDVASMQPSILLNRGMVDESIVAAKQLLDARPYSVRNLLCAGNVFVKTGHNSEGLQLLKKSTYFAPESRYVRLNYARMLAIAGQEDQAVWQYESLCEQFPHNWSLPLSELADIHLAMRQPKLACEKLKKVLQTEPNNARVRKKFGLALAQMGKIQEGFEEFIHGFAIDERGLTEAMNQTIKKNGSSVEQAIIEHQTKILAYPKDVQLKLDLAQLFICVGRINDAKNVLTELETTDNKNPAVHELLAGVLHRLHDSGAANVQFQMAATVRK